MNKITKLCECCEGISLIIPSGSATPDDHTLDQFEERLKRKDESQ